jgi:hypothetical protein
LPIAERFDTYHLILHMKTLLLLACVCTSLFAAPQPNFLFVIADDHRWDAMGVVQR